MIKEVVHYHMVNGVTSGGRCGCFIEDTGTILLSNTGPTFHMHSMRVKGDLMWGDIQRLIYK